jgi:hypothetical protein
MKKIPCEEPQDCGWTCNEGHLCNSCKCELKIQKAIKKERERIMKIIIYDCMGEELTDYGWKLVFNKIKCIKD